MIFSCDHFTRKSLTPFDLSFNFIPRVALQLSKSGPSLTVGPSLLDPSTPSEYGHKQGFFLGDTLGQGSMVVQSDLSYRRSLLVQVRLNQSD